MYEQVLDPVGGSLFATALFAALPLITLFVLLGRMISPQNLAIGAAAVGLAAQEGELFRKVLGWSLILLLVMCVIVLLQSLPILSWMVV
jgi:L-lactate permease